MHTEDIKLGKHSKSVLDVLGKSSTPLSAYDILEKLRKRGVKAPATVYRALETLVGQGMVHRIESINAFVACHNKEADHGSQFAVCRDCGTVVEIHDHSICQSIAAIGKKLKFRIEREMLELLGLCQKCDKKA